MEILKKCLSFLHQYGLGSPSPMAEERGGKKKGFDKFFPSDQFMPNLINWLKSFFEFEHLGNFLC